MPAATGALKPECFTARSGADASFLGASFLGASFLGSSFFGASCLGAAFLGACCFGASCFGAALGRSAEGFGAVCRAGLPELFPSPAFGTRLWSRLSR